MRKQTPNHFQNWHRTTQEAISQSGPPHVPRRVTEAIERTPESGFKKCWVPFSAGPSNQEHRLYWGGTEADPESRRYPRITEHGTQHFSRRMGYLCGCSLSQTVHSNTDHLQTSICEVQPTSMCFTSLNAE